MSNFTARLHLRTKLVVTAALTTAAVAAPMVASQTAANAWPWSGYVHVAGHAGCNQFLNSPRLIQIWAGNEYAQGGFNWLNNYGVDFQNVPSGGETAWAKITCHYAYSDTYSYWRSFWLTRQTVGSQENVSFQG